uniref:Angiogenic factor with G patch and FHA domains 1 n=1 Tax=Mola mola TaxID=94237 RepID=A0A3Q3WC21_MOLML
NFFSRAVEGIEDGEKDTESEEAELRLQIHALKQELQECRAELSRLQKQLNQSERLHRSTESYNEDLRKQVDKLSAEIHERKKRDKKKVDSETQTEEYVWTETDYYNYYYGGYSQNPEASDTPETLNAVAAVSAADGSDVTEVATSKEAAAAELSGQSENCVPATTEEGDGGSIADMLRATAEEAMTQTGFVFDETTGMYYDHSTGFYYDSASQLYYDANTGIYYYYDADSGRYQFHSKIEVPSAKTVADPFQDKSDKEKKGRKLKKVFKKNSTEDCKELVLDEVKVKEEETDWGEQTTTKRTTESRKQKRRSLSPDMTSRGKDSSKQREESDKSLSKRKKQKNGLRSDDRGREKKKTKKSKSKKRKKKKKKSSRSDDSEENSEPEEGEITESEKEDSPRALSTASSSPSRESPESEMETQSQEDIWPPCVRVTVVRSPVLQVGTLFIITADSPATVGREKDMDHAIRIPEMGVSKFHAEVYFDPEQQSYMLVDQGSQNGTVINGNRILQPKTKCEPHALMHGDEVKMGETVLSFHIHSGTDTCDGCEPGDEENDFRVETKGAEADEGQIRTSNEFEEAKTLKNPKYKDRAESRRQTVGSEGVFQRDDAAASDEKCWKKWAGRKERGWVKRIELKIRKSQSGLGAGAAMSLDSVSIAKTKSMKNWEKARERFADSCQPDATSTKTPKNMSPKTWVRSEETETTNTPPGCDTEGQS